MAKLMIGLLVVVGCASSAVKQKVIDPVFDEGQLTVRMIANATDLEPETLTSEEIKIVKAAIWWVKSRNITRMFNATHHEWDRALSRKRFKHLQLRDLLHRLLYHALWYSEFRNCSSRRVFLKEQRELSGVFVDGECMTRHLKLRDAKPKKALKCVSIDPQQRVEDNKMIEVIDDLLCTFPAYECH